MSQPEILYRFYGGNRNHSEDCRNCLLPICAKLLHRHYIGQPTLLNRYYRGTCYWLIPHPRLLVVSGSWCGTEIRSRRYWQLRLSAYSIAGCTATVTVCPSRKNRHNSGNRHYSAYHHYWLFRSVPSDFTGTISGNGHYSASAKEGRLHGTGQFHARGCWISPKVYSVLGLAADRCWQLSILNM